MKPSKSMQLQSIGLSLTLLVALCGCKTAGTRPDRGIVESESSLRPRTDAEAIRRELQGFVDADIAGNRDVLSRCLLDGVVWMPPDEAVIVGKHAVLDYLRDHQAPPTLRVTPTAIEVSDGSAFLRGVFEFEVQGERTTGKMAQYWKHDQSRWKIGWDIWNLD